jgi:hypothetical protein
MLIDEDSLPRDYMTTSFALTEKSTTDILENWLVSGPMKAWKNQLAYDHDDLTGWSGTAEGAAGSDPAHRTKS